MLQLRGTIEVEDIQKIDIDQKLYKNIVQSLKGFGYNGDQIRASLQKYEGEISKETISDVIKRIISQI